jgi:hypothetical protein
MIALDQSFHEHVLGSGVGHPGLHPIGARSETEQHPVRQREFVRDHFGGGCVGSNRASTVPARPLIQGRPDGSRTRRLELRLAKGPPFWRCPLVSAIDSAFLVCSVPGMELLFKIVEVAPTGDRLIAAADNLAVARAAFDTAVALWPNVAIELRQKARVILDSGSQPGGVIHP